MTYGYSDPIYVSKAQSNSSPNFTLGPKSKPNHEPKPPSISQPELKFRYPYIAGMFMFRRQPYSCVFSVYQPRCWTIENHLHTQGREPTNRRGQHHLYIGADLGDEGGNCPPSYLKFLKNFFNFTNILQIAPQNFLKSIPLFFTNFIQFLDIAL